MMLDENCRNNRVGRLILVFTVSLVPRPFTIIYIRKRKGMRERREEGSG